MSNIFQQKKVTVYVAEKNHLYKTTISDYVKVKK